MGVTITINGLSLIHQDSNGASTATLPNVCHTPSAGPIPYGSVAFSRDLLGGSRSVRVDGGYSAATSRSVFARSTGDEAGVQGGVVSGVHGAESSFLTASPDVRIEGSPAARLTDKMLNNHGNTINAGGDTNDLAGKKTRARKPDEVEKVLVTVLGEDGKRVHAPVTVVLRPVKQGKGIRYSTVSKKDRGAITLYNVKQAKYRVIVTHDCYPEGIVEHEVKDLTEKVTVQLKRVKLRDAADGRAIRLGVRFTNLGDPNNVEEPSHLTGAKDQFHDLVGAAFWARHEGQPFDFNNPEQWARFQPGNAWITAAAVEAVKLGMNVEVTPLFWMYGFEGDLVESWKKKTVKKHGKTRVTWKKGSKAIPWSPNPKWLRPIGDPAVALALVKSFITKVVTAYKEQNLLGAVKRWVVINEPMNILMRDVTRTAPFLNALMPTVADPDYAKKDLVKLKRQKDRPPALRKLAPQAIDNMVAILQHAHASIPDDSLLIVNDYGIEGCDEKHGLTGMRAQRFRELIEGMLARIKDPALLGRLRIGLQAHLKSGGELGADSKSKGKAKKGELEGSGERNDFGVTSVRKQMQWFKARKLRICVTECDLLLPDVKYEVKVPGKKKLQPREGLDEHVALGTVDGKKKKPGFDADGFFNSKLRRTPYLRAFTTQRKQQRDLVAAILGQSNVDSFVWWDFDDDLQEDAGGSNFRYHGYLFHRHLVCKHCKHHPSMQVADDAGTYYKKPNYWGTVAAFMSPPGSGF